MKRFFVILILLIFFICGVSAEVFKTARKEYKVITSDGFNIHAELMYPKSKTQKEYKTVVLLHSLGYSSEWWGALPNSLMQKGYAVVFIDLRGHGKSVYNTKLARISWKNMTNNAYAKYPNDVSEVLDKIKSENKRVFFNTWAIVGSDIGASTAVSLANQNKYKPKTIVMISPSVNIKGLYIPVKLAELENIDILSISGTDDIAGQKAEEYLKRFAQSTFATYISESKSSGIMLLKNDSSLVNVITSWIEQYLN